MIQNSDAKWTYHSPSRTQYRSGARQHHLGARRRALSIARGLDVTSPLYVEAHAQDLQFQRYQQHIVFVDMTIPTMLGGLTITSPPIVAVILRQQLAYLYDLTKLSISLSRVYSCFIFITPDTRRPCYAS
jgi:hypothetical protein